MTSGRLYLVPAPLDLGCEDKASLQACLPEETLHLAARLRYWISENARSTRAYLKRIGQIHPLAHPLQDLHIIELPREVHKRGDHDGRFDARGLLEAAVAGHDLGLVCEAGLPAIADPGSSVVRAAHELGIPVTPLIGPSSLMLALAASGLSGQSFAFVGYLPQEANERSRKIAQLEALATKTGQTQLFIETPYRNAALFAALLQTLKPSTRLSVSSALTLSKSFSLSQSVRQWQKAQTPPMEAPAVFAIGR